MKNCNAMRLPHAETGCVNSALVWLSLEWANSQTFIQVLAKNRGALILILYYTDGPKPF